MSVTAGALSKVLVGSSVANLSSAAATGGTGPYTYQWYRSTTSGFTPGASNLISGATGLTLADSGLIPNTTYYYVVIATDTGAGNATSNSTQLTVLTEPSLSQNQFAQQSVVGILDMTVGPTNVISCQVDSSVANNTAPNNVIQPGQAVKLVTNTSGGVPRVAPCTSKSDQCIGFVKFNQKDIQYAPGQALEVAQAMSVIWCMATGAITQGAEVCLDPTYVGGVQATGNTATIVGLAFDGCSAAGLIRVRLVDNYAYSTG